jgi:type II secretory pathway component PulF
MNDAAKTPIAINYAPPATRRFRLPAFSLFAFLAVACALFLIYLIIELFIPRVENLYHDFGMKLSQSTQLLLDVAMFGANPNYIPAACLAVAAGFVAPLVRPSRRRSKRRQWIIPLLTINAILVGILIVAILVLAEPLFLLLRAVAGGR